MIQNKVMAWVDHLPEVGDSILHDRDSIVRVLTEASALAKQAEELRHKAYTASLELEARVKHFWSIDEIDQAKSLAN